MRCLLVFYDGFDSSMDFRSLPRRLDDVKQRFLQASRNGNAGVYIHGIVHTEHVDKVLWSRQLS